MKKLITLALVAGFLAVAGVGCGETAKKSTEVKGPSNAHSTVIKDSTKP